MFVSMDINLTSTIAVLTKSVTPERILCRSSIAVSSPTSSLMLIYPHHLANRKLIDLTDVEIAELHKMSVCYRVMLAVIF